MAFAGVAESADAHVWGACVYTYGFKSRLPHQIKATRVNLGLLLFYKGGGTWSRSGVEWQPKRLSDPRTTKPRSSRRESQSRLPHQKIATQSGCYFFIQLADLAYHHRTKCGGYHQLQRSWISSRPGVYLTATWWYTTASRWFRCIPLCGILRHSSCSIDE